MDQITQLRWVLQPHLGWHGARLAFVALFLIALFRVKTVNLAELATGFCGNAHTDSHYKRLQRFFADFELDYSGIAYTVVRLTVLFSGDRSPLYPNQELDIVRCNTVVRPHAVRGSQTKIEVSPIAE